MTERLQKFMAEAGIGSRRACEKMITDGLVTVNGETASVGMSVDPSIDTVYCCGKPVVKTSAQHVILFYKPRGVLCTSEDPQGRETVQDYFKSVPERLYNVGRLDYYSEGLLLMTNDGELANRMTHPRYKVEKTYYAVCDGTLTDSEIASLTDGVQLEDGMTAPAKVSHVRQTVRGDTCCLITIREGRNRQIRRMFAAVGHKTLRLKREQVGPLTLGTLKEGEWRELSADELEALRAALGL